MTLYPAVVALRHVAVAGAAEDGGAVEDQLVSILAEAPHEVLHVVHAHGQPTKQLHDRTVACSDVGIRVAQPGVLVVVLHALSRAGEHETENGIDLDLPVDVGK